MEKWLKCPNKSELIHNALNSIHSVNGMVNKIKNIEDSPDELAVDSPAKPAKKNKGKNILCEHGQVKGQCMVKGCRYGR